VAYLLWIVSTGLGILVLNMVRETILLWMVVSSSLGEPTASEIFYANLRATAVQNWSLFLIGILVLILLVGIENFYRISATAGKLTRGFFLVSWIEFVVLFIAHSSYYALLQTFRPAAWTSYALPAGEFLLAALFFWLYRRQLKKVPATA
ncbi:MAG: hypothetical protein IH586_20635, partial [Anaerolineaceae bacterium]|nr:hypothetical protein [Anaerolineaceae bacterium]